MEAQPKYTIQVSCSGCNKTWFKKKSAIATWSGKCMSCVKKGSVPWNKKWQEKRERKMVEVSCKQCSVVFSRREDAMKNWSGRCKKCASKYAASCKQKRIYTCADCPKIILSTSLRCKKCSVKYRSGENHYKWKGGVTDKNRYLRTLFIKYTKPQVLKRDNYTCQICFTKGGNLHIDHTNPWSKHPEQRFDINNCKTMCMSCHYEKTFNRKIPDGIVWGNNLTKYVVQ